MEENLKRKDKETYLQYVKRLTENKKVYDLDYTEYGDLILGDENNYSSENIRKGFYLIDKIFKKADLENESEIINKCEDKNDTLIELGLKKAELEKEKIKLQDQRRQYNAFLRTEARWEELRDIVEYEARQLNNSKPFLPHSSFIKYGEQKGSLLLSDLHIGIDVDTYLNVYNIDVAKIYMKVLEQKVIAYCKLHDVGELNLEMLGDLISGLIHITTRMYQQENIIKQTMICAEMLSEFVYNLSKELSKINVYFAIGNHSRVVANYKEHLSEENFEYLILWHLKTRLSNINNIEFKENLYDDEMITYEVFGKKIISVHGHKDKPENAIMRLSSMLGVLFDELHLGHYHNMQFKNKTLINGVFCGVDQHSQDLRFSNQPSQVLKIYYENGDECIYDIKLN